MKYTQATLLMLMLMLPLSALSCQPSPKSKPKPKPQLKYSPVVTGEASKIDAILEPSLIRELKLEERISASACHRVFEPHERPLEQWPFEDEPSAMATLFACKAEAYTALGARGHMVAYALPQTPDNETAVDMRLVVYDDEGKLSFSHRVVRADQGSQFLSNFRESFALELSPHLICTGTAWELNIQIHCLGRDDGDVKWRGQLPFWSGISPQAVGMSLYFADLSALRRHYPYSGVEQRYKRLDGPGGRLGLYATDGQHLFFGPNRGGPYTLTAYSFKDMEHTWGRELGRELDATFTFSSPEANLLVLKHNNELWAIDTQNGDLLWQLDVGQDRPQLASINQTLYVLWRREEQPNVLVALNARDGKAQWWANTPTGVTRLSAMRGQLLLGELGAASAVSHPRPASAPMVQGSPR